MSEDEKKAAAELQEQIDQENCDKNVTNDRMVNIEKMLKSVLDSTEVKTDETAQNTDELDYLAIDPVEMAKSMAADPDGQKDFLNRFIEESQVSAVDLIDEDGYALMTEDLRKSIEDGEEQGAEILGLILQTMDTNHELSAKRDEVMLAGMAQMSKSFAETLEELGEMKKSMLKPGTVETVEAVMPDLDGAVQTPGSSDIGGTFNEVPELDNGTIIEALQKSFKDGQPTDVQARFYEFMENLNSGATLEELQGVMTQSELNVLNSNLS